MLPFWGSWREAPEGDFDPCFRAIGVNYVDPPPTRRFATAHLPHTGAARLGEDLESRYL
jgi:hypothetical protein